MPPRRLDSRSHRIQPRDYRISENARPEPPMNTTRPQTPIRPSNPAPTMISTMIATRGVTIEVISPNGDISRTNPEFENIARAAFRIALCDDPSVSFGELDVEEDLEEEHRLNAALYYHDGSMRNLSVKILFDDTYRIGAINEMLESVDVETLDSEDNCSICMESYATAATLSEPDTVVTIPEEDIILFIANGFEDSIDTSNDSKNSFTISTEPHHAVKIKTCGHVFGGRCITKWLKENNTCPMCRGKVSLPAPYHLRVWVV
ncbi:hypothetical protein BGAL_0616g00060 [Botrytis galanthina]|uniref:RING-type domain-containing protein n=1 Tax=Botrytis galanthina TaxID=278940 RepID=A0A4S8QSZ1_9HELO|nr:hypothetical protein BGAL_0616g00060 [Botrytis galanthina]